jgi:hypothetical protein
MPERKNSKNESQANSKGLAEESSEQNKLVREKTDEILSKISTNDISREDAQWIDSVYRITAIRKHFSESNRKKWLSSHALIALVCIVLGGLLLVFRVGDVPAIGFLSTNNVSVQLRCKVLTISLAESGDPNIVDFDELVLTDYLEIEGLDTVVVSNAPIAIHDSTAGLNLKMSADPIFLDAIDLGIESTLRIEQSGDLISLTVNGDRVKVGASFDSAEFRQPVNLKVHSQEDFDIPLFARFESANNVGTGVTIKFRQNGPVNILKGKRVTSLQFSDSYVYGADTLRYISTIQSGTLTLSDVDKTVDLHSQDRFILQNLEGWIVDFDIANGMIELFFKGTVRDIHAGPEGSEKDLSPSLLEYFFKNQPFVLFWGAVVFMWGFLNAFISKLRAS